MSRTIYHIEVGTLPKEKAEAYLKEAMNKIVDAREKGNDIFMPMRNGQPTVKVEVIPED